MNEYLRKECKLLKALQGITYTEIAEYLDLSPSSFYNWLCNAYDFGEERQSLLNEIITNLKE
jgi:DNA-directed RNA polymerase specialized sigma24 family protein